MRISASVVGFLFALCTCLTGAVKLGYQHEGQIYSVDGFILSRPYHEEDGEQQPLPLGGQWVMEIADPAFWDDCAFPVWYRLNKEFKPFVDREAVSQYTIFFDLSAIPVYTPDDPDLRYAVSWASESFDDSIIVLGWYRDGEVRSLELVVGRQWVHPAMDHAFRQFRVDQQDLDGFPFICVLDQSTLEIRKPVTDFSRENPDYLYRLACRGTSEDFRALDISTKRLVKVVRSKRSSVTVSPNDELTLMHGAALYGNVDVLNYFREIKADKVKIRGNNLVIETAINAGRLDAVKTLVGFGHSPLKRTNLQFNPYCVAIQRGYLEIVDFLTDNPKNLKYTRDGQNSAELAVLSLRPEIYDLISSKASDQGIRLKTRKVRDLSAELVTAMHNNCLLGYQNLVEVLVGRGVDINSPAGMKSPIVAAVQSGNADLVAYLIGLGVELEETYGNGNTTLMHIAAEQGHAGVIPVLAEAGLDVDARDSAGVTPLYLAVISKKARPVRELLRLGADPNLTPDLYPAPIWMAVVQDERETVQGLMESGANCDLDQSLALQLMDYALAFDIPEAVEISLGECLTPDFMFVGGVPGAWVANYYSADQCLQVLMEAGANIDAKPDWSFETAGDSITQAFTRENLDIKYPERLGEKYGNMEVRVSLIIDPRGDIRFPKFLDPLPWDLQLFLRETMKKLSIRVPTAESSGTAYKVVLPLVLKSDDFGVSIFELEELDMIPQPTHRVAPTYPYALKHAGISGWVKVVFIVDETGAVREAKIAESSHHGFEAPAINAVMQWKFKPGFVAGVPVKTRMMLPLKFNLN